MTSTEGSPERTSPGTPARLFSKRTLTQYGRRVLLMYEMLRDWRKGVYPLPRKTVAAIAAALVYFISPIDFIPDFIPVIGHLDDLVIMAACFKYVQKDVRAYAEAQGKNLADYGL